MPGDRSLRSSINRESGTSNRRPARSSLPPLGEPFTRFTRRFAANDGVACRAGYQPVAAKRHAISLNYGYYARRISHKRGNREPSAISVIPLACRHPRIAVVSGADCTPRVCARGFTGGFGIGPNWEMKISQRAIEIAVLPLCPSCCHLCRHRCREIRSPRGFCSLDSRAEIPYQPVVLAIDTTEAFSFRRF